ncbi:MAG TPA: DUF4349 domain-containing protein [Gemmatimonadales bacterium]|nr:DUF4349 domain-containing protein [Gemmatimonadales bacterium]
MRTRTIRRLTVPVCLLTATLVAACERGAPAALRERAVALPPRGPMAAKSVPSPARAEGAAAADALGPAAPGDARTTPLQLPANPDAAASMIVRTGTASVEVDSLEPAVARLRDAATRAGGYVGSTQLQAGRDQTRSALLEVKVPAPRFDEVVGGLRPIGRVEFVNVSAEDVGEEYVDVTARVANARRLEERLLTLLATRTGRLADVLQIERELARVREEIERLDGRLRYLRAHAALSTLAVTLHEPLPVVGEPGRHPIGEAFRQAWRNLVGSVAFAIAAAGVLVPLALVAGAVIFVGRKLRRARKPVSGPVAEPAA